MSALEYNEIKPGKYIIYNDEPFDVIESHVARTQKRKPQNQTKLKSLVNGKVISVSFHASEKAEEADIEKRPFKFVYSNKGEHVFCEEKNPSKRYTLGENVVGTKAKFLKTDVLVEGLVWTDDNDDEQIIGIKLPVKIEYKVKSAPPAVRGNTAQGATKDVELENGLTVSTPLFIDEGDGIIVNTDTGEYVERSEKK